MTNLSQGGLKLQEKISALLPKEVPITHRYQIATLIRTLRTSVGYFEDDYFLVLNNLGISEEEAEDFVSVASWISPEELNKLTQLRIVKTGEKLGWSDIVKLSKLDMMRRNRAITELQFIRDLRGELDQLPKRS